MSNNTGSKNTGSKNTGNRNTGNRNTGNWNNGNRNNGDWNTGNWNNGNRNTGDWNTGHLNTGHLNTGNRNTGNRNTGDWNTGDGNTGDGNTGNWNTGDWNTGNWNNGYCNTITPDECFIFNKKGSRKDWDKADKPSWIYVDLTKWVNESKMTDKEKEAYPSYTTTGGYLKCYSSLKQAYIESWDKADKEDREKTFNLPNFDINVFEEIFGFNPKKEETKTITIDGKDIKISKESFDELKKQLGEVK